MVSTIQRQADAVFTKHKEYAVLDTVTWTVSEVGELTGSSSSKAVIQGIFQSLTDEDYTRITAGHIPKSDLVMYTARAYTIHAGKYLVSTATTQQFVYYPTNNSTTLPSTYGKYEVMKVEDVGNIACSSPVGTSSANKVYTKSYLKEVMATG